MSSTEQVVGWARQLAEQLQENLKYRDDSMYGGYWELEDDSLSRRVLAKITEAFDLLSTHAGENSDWTRQARAACGDDDNLGTPAQAVGEILRLWADRVEAGASNLVSSAGQNARAVASTDVMAQVRMLIEDKDVHPAAPIVLAGAALETAIRGVIDDRGLSIKGKPGIAAYTDALRSADVISKQDAKDLVQMGGLRNAAAHGDFDQLSTERAGLMEQQVNLFLARLRTLLGDE